MGGRTMKTIIAAIALLLVATSVADARKRQRIVVQPQGRVIMEHPYGVTYVLSYILCGFHVFSVGPNPKPGQLGSCASWFNYPTHGPV